MQCFKKSGEIFGKLVFNQPLTVALLLCALFVYLFLLLCSLRSALVCWFKNCALVCAAAPKSMLHMHAGVGVQCCVQLYACVCVCVDVYEIVFILLAMQVDYLLHAASLENHIIVCLLLTHSTHYLFELLLTVIQCKLLYA